MGTNVMCNVRTWCRHDDGRFRRSEMYKPHKVVEKNLIENLLLAPVCAWLEVVERKVKRGPLFSDSFQF